MPPQRYRDISPDATEALRKRNLQRRKKQLATIKKKEKDYKEANIKDAEETKVFHELESIKLYLFDIAKRLTAIERQLQSGAGTALPGVILPNPFNRESIYKGPNKDKGQDFVRKNIAQILKNMVPPSAMDMMPKEVQEAYHNILGVMAPPNDPVWDKESPKPDPREPVLTREKEDWDPPTSPDDPGAWRVPPEKTLTADNEKFPYKDVGELWNSLADTAKRLEEENIDLVGEVAKAASEKKEDEEDDEDDKES